MKPVIAFILLIAFITGGVTFVFKAKQKTSNSNPVPAVQPENRTAYLEGVRAGHREADSVAREYRKTCMQYAYLMGVRTGNLATHDGFHGTLGDLWKRDSALILAECK